MIRVQVGEVSKDLRRQNSGALAHNGFKVSNFFDTSNELNAKKDCPCLSSTLDLVGGG